MFHAHDAKILVHLGCPKCQFFPVKVIMRHFKWTRIFASTWFAGTRTPTLSELPVHLHNPWVVGPKLDRLLCRSTEHSQPCVREKTGDVLSTFHQPGGKENLRVPATKNKIC